MAFYCVPMEFSLEIPCALTTLSLLHLKTRKKAKIRNQYNHVPHLTKDTVGESNKNTRKHQKQQFQEVSLSQQVAKHKH